MNLTTLRICLGVALAGAAAAAACASTDDLAEPIIEDGQPDGAPPPEEGDASVPPPDPDKDSGYDPTILPTAIVKGVNTPRGVAVDDSFVYFGSKTDNAIYKVPLLGGTPERVDTGTAVKQPWVHAVDDDYVYFANVFPSDAAGAVGRVPKAGGAAEIMVPNVSPWGMTIDATNVYFTDQRIAGDGSVKRVAKTCSVPCTATVMVPGQTFPMGIATDGVNVYWANEDEDVTYAYPGGPITSQVWKGTLRKIAIGATTTDPEATAVLSGLHLPAGVAVTASRLFVGTIDDKSVHTIVFETNQEQIFESVGMGFWMAADDQYAYWTTGGSGEQASVYRLLYDGKNAEGIASNQAGPIGIAVTKDALYWANFDGGEIIRLEKKK